MDAFAWAAGLGVPGALLVAAGVWFVMRRHRSPTWQSVGTPRASQRVHQDGEGGVA